MKKLKKSVLEYFRLKSLKDFNKCDKGEIDPKKMLTINIFKAFKQLGLRNKLGDGRKNDTEMKLIQRRCSRPRPPLTTAIFCSSFQPEGERRRGNKKSSNKPSFHSVLISVERLFMLKIILRKMFCKSEWNYKLSYSE